MNELLLTRLLGIGLSVGLLGCALSSAPNPPESGEVTPPTPLTLPPTSTPTSPSTPTPTSSPTEQGQTLPISAELTIASQVIQLEVARSPQEQRMGLMYRTQLADDRGMLFPFSPARSVAFWMKNTLIPLDMVFLREGVVKFIAAEVPPCTADPCPSYGPPPLTPIDNVIELRSGRAAELGLKVGDRLVIRNLAPTSQP